LDIRAPQLAVYANNWVRRGKHERTHEGFGAAGAGASPAERLELVDEILASLDRPDEFVNALWYREAENRLAAYRRGEIKTVSVEEVIAKYLSR
jgi:putative addiction module component (TIGR02574 family)